MVSPFFTVAGRTPIDPLLIFTLTSDAVVETKVTGTSIPVPRPWIPPSGLAAEG